VPSPYHRSRPWAATADQGDWHPHIVVPVVRKALALAALLLLTGCGASSEQMAVVQVHASRPLLLLVVGDGLSVGFYASSPSDDFVSLLAANLDQGRPISTTLVARPGETAVAASGWRLAIPSDDVVVELGTNDFGDDVALSAFSAAYASVLGHIRRASPDAKLTCAGLWSAPNAVNGIGADASAYDDVIRLSCGAARGRYVDLSTVFSAPADHGPAGTRTPFGTSDWLDPNDAGQAAIAETLLEAMGARSGVGSEGPH
jgi:lysophospholipase L1-like esterase